jgi:N-acetylglucosamine kinase-like BadF-type ATPase
MTILLGVDGGSTKTHAALVNESGELLGFGMAGISNQNVVGFKEAMSEVAAAVHTALESAHLASRDIHLGCFCLAGADFPDDFKKIGAALQEHQLAGRVLVKNDTAAGLRSGLTRSWGVVVVCGTGFNAAGRSRDGREIGLPSYGPLTGDWGGGGSLGVEVLGAVMRAWDGRGQPTLLARLVLEDLHLATEDDILQAIYHRSMTRSQIVGFTPLLFQAAEAGDAVARELVIRMGSEVGVTANAFLKRLDLVDTDAEVVLSGSVFKGKGPLLIDTARQVVHAVSPQAQIVRPLLEPVAGAALLALEFAGLEATPETHRRMQAAPQLAIASRGG